MKLALLTSTPFAYPSRIFVKIKCSRNQSVLQYGKFNNVSFIITGYIADFGKPARWNQVEVGTHLAHTLEASTQLVPPI